MPTRADHAETRRKLLRLFSGERVLIETAHVLIQESAFWLHPDGPRHAPRHLHRVQSGPFGWELPFGANYFLVEAAIRSCVGAVLLALKESEESSKSLDVASLRASLDLSIRGAVANYDHAEYPTYWNVENGYMRFGTQAIHVASFRNAILRVAGIA